MALVYYFVQNDAGESASSPNCARLPAGVGGAGGRAPTVADVLAALALVTSTGSFHVRFQVAQEGATRYLDLLGAADAVPTVAGGHVFAKLLRLDTLSTQARAGAAALPALRAYAAARCACVCPESDSSRL